MRNGGRGNKHLKVEVVRDTKKATRVTTTNPKTKTKTTIKDATPTKTEMKEGTDDSANAILVNCVINNKDLEWTVHINQSKP